MTLHEDALPERLFNRLVRGVRAVGAERLARTYQTTFWFEPERMRPSAVTEEAVLHLRRHVSAPHAGVEWWLSRMRATDVKVDFHKDCDERLLRAGGAELHPRMSSVLFLNRVRGGALAVTDEPPCEENPARAPARLDLDLVSPRPNRYVIFRGDLTHGVLDSHNQIPSRRLREPARLRLALIVNYWDHRPTDVPTFAEAGIYRALARLKSASPRTKVRAP